MYKLRKNAADIALAMTIGAVLFAGVAYLAFSRSTTKQVDETVIYSHTGVFSYEASSSAPEVYDNGAVTTGDPVFPVLSQEISIQYDYQFVTEAEHALQGSISLSALITTDTGWVRTVPLSDAVPFDGASASVTGVLDLDAVTALVQTLETESGVVNRDYEVLITPTIDLLGDVAGSAISLVYQPDLALRFDHDQLYISASPGATENPLAPTQGGTTIALTTVSNSIGMFAWSIPVTTARVASLAGLGLVLIAAALVALLLAPGMLGTNGPIRARQREGAMVVSVQGPVDASNGSVVELTNFSDLAVVANRMDGLILEDESGGVRSYYVQDQYVTYRYSEVEASTEYVIQHNFDKAA